MFNARVYAFVTFIFAAVYAGFYFTGSVTDAATMLLGLSVVGLLTVYTIAAYAVQHITEGVEPGRGHRHGRTHGHPIG